MDKLDHLLADHFERALLRLAADPDFAARRRARAPRAILTHPLRAFCLVLRASDHRLPDHATAHPLAGHLHRDPHQLHLTARAVQHLLAPVRIPYPGLPHDEAAALLGLDVSHIARWIRKGVFQVVHHRRRHQGKPTPYLYTPQPLDPSARYGCPPDQLWKNLWQSLPQKLNPHFHQWLTRVPRLRPRPDRPSPQGWFSKEIKMEFRGFSFQCPGRWRPLPSSAHHTIPPATPAHLIRKRQLLYEHRLAMEHWHAQYPVPDADALDNAPTLPDDLMQTCLTPPPLDDVETEYDLDIRCIPQVEEGEREEGGRDKGQRDRGQREEERRTQHLPASPLSPLSLSPLSLSPLSLPPLQLLYRKPCRRLVTRLYCPVPLMTIPAYLGIEIPFLFQMPHLLSAAEAHPAPTASPRISDNACASAAPETLASPRYRTFACKTCWNPTYFKATAPAGLWNLFITHLSAGLLTGRDVPRPHEATVRRRRRVYTHRKASRDMRHWQIRSDR